MLAAALLFVHWLVFAFRHLRVQPPKIGKFVGLLLAGMVPTDAMAAASADPRATNLNLLDSLLLSPHNEA